MKRDREKEIKKKRNVSIYVLFKANNRCMYVVGNQEEKKLHILARSPHTNAREKERKRDWEMSSGTHNRGRKYKHGKEEKVTKSAISFCVLVCDISTHTHTYTYKKAHLISLTTIIKTWII